MGSVRLPKSLAKLSGLSASGVGSVVGGPIEAIPIVAGELRTTVIGNESIGCGHEIDADGVRRHFF